MADLLGIGIYSPSEAALYARVTTRLMNRWMFGNGQGSPVITPQIGTPEDRDVTFLDFVQALAIRRIRKEHPGISLQTIREAYIRAKEEYGTPYPFALDSTRIGLFGPPDEPRKQVIWLCVGEDEEGARRYFQLTGKKCHNQMIGEVVRTYAYRLVFDETTKLAKKYLAFPTIKDAPEYIVMDPQVRFGEPFLESCGYTARTLLDASISEGSPSRAATIYGVEPEQVELAREYFDYLSPPAA
ncbi:MAG: hypothetical protein WCB27_21795 [Thermoguttaceae bacterium]